MPAESDHDDHEVDDTEDSYDPKPSRFDRLRTGLQSATTGSGSNARSTKKQVERLDERERRLSFAAAGASALIGIVIYIAETQNKHFRLAKGQLTPQTTLLLGIAFGAVLVAATLFGRRALVGFVALMVFLVFGTRYFAGVPFLALAAWLLYRSFKIQKEANAALRAAKAEKSATAPARSRSAAVSARAAKKTGSKKGPSMPEANKRYTPKRPPPPPPKPTRRERKAAQASD